MWASWPSRAGPIPAPHGVNAAHLLGYVDRASATDVTGSDGAVTADETVGRDGLEAQYDGVLRGTHGTTSVAVDPRGVVVDRLATTAPVAGRDVVTHISAPVQAAAEQSLSQAVATARSGGFAADSGGRRRPRRHQRCGRRGGELPRLRPARSGPAASRRRTSTPCATRPPARRCVSRVTGATMPPASTFKVVSTTAAAAMGVDLNGQYDCTSTFQVGDRAFANYESHDYGVLSLQRNLEVSCDTIWYRFAYQSWLAQGGLAAQRTTPATRSSRRPRPTGSASGPASTCPARWPAGSPTGCGSARRGRTRRPRPARGPRAATRTSRPRTRPAPTTSRRSPSRTATPAGSTAPATRRTSPSARATSR